MKKLTLISIILFLTQSGIAVGQKLQADLENSQIEIKGTSSLHDWESNVTAFEFTVNQEGSNFQNLQGAILVKSIKSGKDIMDDKTYDALGAEDFPEITVSGTDLQLASGKLMGTISVTMKGTTKDFDISATSTLVSGDIKIKGEVAIDMTEFGIDPPTAMFGSLTTGKDVTIAYSILLK